MTGFKNSLVLGKYPLSSNVIIAPMAGFTDYVFRQLLALYKPGLIFCEMVKIEALVRKDPHTLHFLKYSENMRPIGAQICGSNPKVAAEAARIIQDLGFDVIDINCGCPAPKIVKDRSGSGMLLQLEVLQKLVTEVVNAVTIPVTLKIRSGWDANSIVAEEIVKIAEDAKISALTIHGRTRQQRYQGNADWEIIRRCKAKAKTIKIIGNGDIWTAEDAAKMFDQTECDGIMIARGSLGTPWLIEDLRERYQQQPITLPEMRDPLWILKKHYALILQHVTEEKNAIFHMRRVGCWYLKSFIGARKVRMEINQARSVDSIMKIINNL